MGMFNDSSLITRGFGIVHRILTRGFGVGDKKEKGKGGVIPSWIHREYLINISAEVLKKDSKSINISSPVNFINSNCIKFSSAIYKENIVNFKIFSSIDHTKLKNILDEI